MSDPARLSDAQRLRVFEESSARLGLTPISVEKDWWVFLALEALFRAPTISSRLTFKGGTSLSKVWKLINRFSEDIDIVVDRKSLGFSGANDPEEAESTSARKRLVERLKTECARCIREEIAPAIREGLETTAGPASFELALDEGDPGGQTLLVRYDSLLPLSQSGYVRPSVKIELGARSGDEPTVSGYIKALAAEGLPGLSWGREVALRALDPARTFLEKLCLIHEENHRPPEKAAKSRSSRHLYDLSCLFNAGIGSRALADPALFGRVFKNRRTYFSYSWMDYETMRPGAFVLVPQPARLDSWRRDYEMLRREMIYGESPEFTELLGQIAAIEDAANANRS